MKLSSFICMCSYKSCIKLCSIFILYLSQSVWCLTVSKLEYQMLNVHFMCFTMTYASQNCPSVTVLVMKSVKKETFTAIELDSRTGTKTVSSLNETMFSLYQNKHSSEYELWTMYVCLQLNLNPLVCLVKKSLYPLISFW